MCWRGAWSCRGSSWCRFRIGAGATESPSVTGPVSSSSLGPLENGFLNYVRTISVMRDASRWRFDADGTVQGYEDVQAYSRRRIADRFTSEMLCDYASAVGAEPFADDFYPGPSVLVSNAAVLSPGGWSLTIAEAQRRFGIANVEPTPETVRSDATMEQTGGLMRMPPGWAMRPPMRMTTYSTPAVHDQPKGATWISIMQLSWRQRSYVSRPVRRTETGW